MPAVKPITKEELQDFAYDYESPYCYASGAATALNDGNYTCTITVRNINEMEWHAYCYLEDYRIAWDIWMEWEDSCRK